MLRITQYVIFPEDWYEGTIFFWSTQWNRRNITQNCFHPQNESHTAKLSFSVVLNLFAEIDKKNFFRGKNVNSKKKKFLWNLFFLNKFEKE